MNTLLYYSRPQNNESMYSMAYKIAYKIVYKIRFTANNVSFLYFVFLQSLNEVDIGKKDSTIYDSPRYGQYIRDIITLYFTDRKKRLKGKECQTYFFLGETFFYITQTYTILIHIYLFPTLRIIHHLSTQQSKV